MQHPLLGDSASARLGTQALQMLVNPVQPGLSKQCKGLRLAFLVLQTPPRILQVTALTTVVVSQGLGPLGEDTGVCQARAQVVVKCAVQESTAQSLEAPWRVCSAQPIAGLLHPAHR
jgi:hypothetical protein